VGCSGAKKAGYELSAAVPFEAGASSSHHKEVSSAGRLGIAVPRGVGTAEPAGNSSEVGAGNTVSGTVCAAAAGDAAASTKTPACGGAVDRPFRLCPLPAGSRVTKTAITLPTMTALTKA